MNELAMTLCTLAAAISGGAITWTFLRFVFNQGWEDRDHCAFCSVLVSKALIARIGPSTEIVCGHCFRFGPPRSFTGLQDTTNAQVEPGSSQARSSEH